MLTRPTLTRPEAQAAPSSTSGGMPHRARQWSPTAHSSRVVTAIGYGLCLCSRPVSVLLRVAECGHVTVSAVALRYPPVSCQCRDRVHLHVLGRQPQDCMLLTSI